MLGLPYVIQHEQHALVFASTAESSCDIESIIGRFRQSLISQLVMNHVLKF